MSVWMADPSAKLVYWLTGVAGTGKTTIAQSVAHMAAEQGCLAATFFFSRTAGSAERRRAAAVIPTLIYQLAYRHEMFRECICRAVSSDRDICERLVATQAKTLFAEALQSSNQRLPLPLVIVLDALDECDKENGLEGGDLIPVLLHSLDKLPFSVKIFITSRLEPSINNMFGRADIHESTVGRRDIEQGIVREDIGRYFRHELDKLAEDRSIPLPFPSDVDFQKLVDRAGGLFIYVRTIVMHVSSEVEDPIDRLADVLRADVDGASEQFADLDALYTQILACALDGVGRNATAQRQLRDVLASLVLIQESLPVTALSVLAGVEERQCKKVLRFLSSILLYDHASHEPVRLMHPSFPDFLVSVSRCTDTRCFVNSAEYHSVLALRCLQIMTADLRPDICDIRDPSLSNANVPDLNQRLGRNTSVQLRYACKYWRVHVQSAGCFHPDLFTALDAFCTKHLLHWLELLSLMNEVPVALRDLPLLLSYLEVCTIRLHLTSTDISLMFRASMICVKGAYILFSLTSLGCCYYTGLRSSTLLCVCTTALWKLRHRTCYWRKPPWTTPTVTVPRTGDPLIGRRFIQKMVPPRLLVVRAIRLSGQHGARSRLATRRTVPTRTRARKEAAVQTQRPRAFRSRASLLLLTWQCSTEISSAKLRQRDEWGGGTGCMRCPEPESSGVSLLLALRVADL
jgi:hypothetical protein